MRLLENCIDNSASSEMKGQIETLREAFSVDVNRPFVLNPSFPFYHGVPAASIDPHIARAYSQADAVATTMAVTNGQVAYSTHPLSPPHSIGDTETKGDSPGAVQSLVMLAAGQGTQAQSSQPTLVDHVAAWNPSRLFECVFPLPRSSVALTRNKQQLEHRLRRQRIRDGSDAAAASASRRISGLARRCAHFITFLCSDYCWDIQLIRVTGHVARFCSRCHGL